MNPGVLRASIVATALLATAIAPSAQGAAPPIDSADRIRAKLEKLPSTLALQPRTPDFTVHIEKRRPMQDIFDVPPWATDPVGWQPPGNGFDLLSVFRYAAKSMADAKRGHDTRVARDEVQRAIADYCAARTVNDHSAAAQMCTGAQTPR